MAPSSTVDAVCESQYYRARYYDPAAGRFISEDPIRFDGGINMFAYVMNEPIDFSDPNGAVKLCCRRVRVPVARQFGACHCFLELPDGVTLGGYFKKGHLLVPEVNNNDDRKPKDKPTCEEIGGDCDKIRQAFNSLPTQTYIVDGTSNAVVEETLTKAGVAHHLPSCAWLNTPPSLPLPSIPSFPTNQDIIDRLLRRLNPELR